MQTGTFKFLCFAALHFFFFFNLGRSAEAKQALLAPISKDPSTNLYTVLVNLKTPLQPTNLHLDLGFSLSWVDCSRRYKSSSYRHVLYNSSLCLEMETGVWGNCFRSPRPGCFNESCQYFAENSVTRELNGGDVFIDSFALPKTDGRNPGVLSVISNMVLSCANTRLLKGLAKGVTGVAALGRYNYSLPAQISRAFSSTSPALFAMCLPSTSSAKGVLIFNSPGPYYFLPGIERSKSLVYTPLLVNPISTGVSSHYWPSDDYFIGVTAIKINGKGVPLNRTLLIINRDLNSFLYGNGGTKIATYTPYTVMHTSIFKAVTEAFRKESAVLNLTLTQPVKPFSVCYAAENTASTRVGPAVPTIDLVLQSEKVVWRMFGANSMVRVNQNGVDAWCLGFLDGGEDVRTSIVIGGHQLQDNLLQIDMGKNRLGFSSSLLFRSTTCSNFNFTTNSSLRM